MGRTAGDTIAYFVLFLMIFSLAPLVQQASSVPVREDEVWSSTTYYNSTTVRFDSNLTVLNGETVVFDNTTVVINGTSSAPVVFDVRSGGRLIIRNGSLVTNRFQGVGTPRKYHIECRGGLTLLDSNISFAGSGDYQASGVAVSDLGLCNIRRSEFYSCINGLFITGGIDRGIYDCIFTNCSSDCIKANSYITNFEARNCTFQDSGGFAFTNFPTRNIYYPKFVNNTVRRCGGGFRLYRNTQGTYLDNRMTDLDGTGIWIEVYYGMGVPKPELIQGNEITRARRGVEVQNSFSSSKFIQNKISDCLEYGASLNCWFHTTVGDNEISGNLFKECGTGLLFVNGTNNLVTRNEFLNNDIGMNISEMTHSYFSYNSFNRSSYYGIHFYSGCSNSNIFLNRFHDNTVHSRDDGAQTWDYKTTGNYWSGMSSYEDLNNDGIVDVPYVIDYNSYDRYPLVVPWGSPRNQPIELSPIDDQEVEVGEWLNLTFSADDPDNDIPFFKVEPEKEIVFHLDPYNGTFYYLGVTEDIGVFEVEVSVLDNNGSRDSDTFFIVVKYHNYPPVVEPIPTLTTNAEVRKIHQLKVSDPNGDKVTVKVENSSAAFPLSINNYLQLSFLPRRGDEGEYKAVLNFSDNNGTFTLAGFRMTVLHSNNPPMLLNIRDLSVEYGKELLFQVMVIEQDPDILSFNVSYSGVGEASINDSGWLRIIPDKADIGVTTVTVHVDDNNGSVVSESLTLTVYVVNYPPDVPPRMVVRAEAGDRMMVYFDVRDPNDERVFVFPNESLPDWAVIHEASLSMLLTPVREDIGTHKFTIRFMDDEFEGANMEVVINVEGTRFPDWLYPKTFEMMEREAVTFDLDFGYTRNGTIWYRVDCMKGFMSLQGSKLHIAPGDGTSREYVLWIYYGVTNGTEAETRELRIVVHRNLSGFWHVVSIEPDKERYTAGDSITASCDWGGYEAPLTLRWEWVIEGSIYSHETGTNSTVTVNFSGSWHIYLYLEGVETPLFAKDFQVKKAPDEGKGISWGRLLFSAAILLIVAAVLLWGFITAMKLKRRYREAMEPPDQEEINLPQGFRSPPPLEREMPPQFIGYGGNDYTGGGGLTPHDASDVRGEEVPQKGPQAGFRQG
ncbi:MAG: right-handed parallel beta-helix repeat-containing protein [Thermoplasmatota archaeon]